MQSSDIAIIGGGIVGLATAYTLTRQFPHLRVVVLEKERELAQHQTGRNSGVLHSGIYYRPGSLRAQNCRTGKLAMEEFCRAEDIDFEICGKVIVAVDNSELPRLDAIHERGQANGVRCELIDRDRLQELEPHVAGIRAIHVPEAGIVNYRSVCQRLAQCVQEAGGKIVCSARVTAIEHTTSSVIFKTTAGDFESRWAINCGGLHCDRLTTLAGQQPLAKILPFRGEYYKLKPSAHHLCRNLIYPVPDPAFPFLGVHFTRMIGGEIECGPNAVLAFAREGYRKLDIRPSDLADTLFYPGFWRLAGKYWRTGCGEMWRSISKRAFVRALQRLVPEIQADDLDPAPSGVRAQAVDPAGTIIDDFLFVESDRIIHVNNAPSPAATASLNVARLIVEKLAPRLE